MTEKHNKYRKEHNAGELERDSKLEKIAQENAENMLETDSTFILQKSMMEKKLVKIYFMV